MSRLANMINAHAGRNQRKLDSLDQAAQAKRDLLDPELRVNVDDLYIQDADSFRLPNGEAVRLTTDEGRTLDSYETNPQTYIDNPKKEESHKRAYAEAFGIDPKKVTREDLIRAGESQKAKFKERLLQYADKDGTIGFRQRGTGEYGRTLVELSDVPLSGRGDNARYTDSFNFEQRMEDFDSGATAEHVAGRGNRGLGTGSKDQLVNFTSGALRMVNDMAQGAAVAQGTNKLPFVDELFRHNRDKLEQVREALISPQQRRRERLAQERNALQSEHYNIQREKYLKVGNGETTASIKAGIDEFTTSVGNIIDTPGAVLDKTVESLPYMLGVATAGRKSVNVAVENLQKKILQNPGVQKNINRKTKGKFQSAEALEKTAAFHTLKFINSPQGKKYLNKVARDAGVTTVALTEGLSTSSEVYDSVRFMSEEEASNSDTYLELREKGLSHNQATKQMAEVAFRQTFSTVALAAGVFSFGTGAGAFEGQLLSGLAGVRKTVTTTAKEAAEEVQQGAIKATAKTLAKGTGKAAVFVGKPGLREAAEESGQAGSGEFLSQLAKFDATGEQVGPGVGRATGEGAVVGFASGAGAQATLGSLKAIATADPKKLLKSKNDYQKANVPKPQVAVEAAKASTDTKPTKGSNLNSEEARKNPREAFQNEIDNVGDQENPVVLFMRLDRLRKQAEAAGQPLTEHQEKVHEVFKDIANEAIAAATTDIAKKEAKDITEDDIAVLTTAAELGIKVNTDNLTDEQRSIVETTVKLAEDFEAAAETREQQLELAQGEGQKRTIRKVHDNKFGDVKEGTNSRPGLGYYARRMREIMNSSRFGEDNTELNSLMSGLRNFSQSQNKYLENARQAVDEQRSVGNFKYVAPDVANNIQGSPALLEILEREQATFDNIVGGLRQRYNDWKTAGSGPAIQNASGRPSDRSRAVKSDQESRRQAREETPRDEALRVEVQDLVKNTEEGTRERRIAIGKLMKKARKADDKGPLQELKKLNRANTEATKKTNKRSKPAAQTNEDGSPKFAREFETNKNLKKVGEIADPTASEDTPSPKTLRQAAKEGSKSVLSYLKERTSNKAASAIADRVSAALGDRDVQIVELTTAEMQDKFNNPAKGAYHNGVIYLNKDKLKSAGDYGNTVLHEAIHAALDGYLKKSPDPKIVKRLRDLNFRVVKALTAEGSPNAITMAGILAKDAEELLTHGITTPYLQNFLKNMQIEDQSAWSRFVQMIADILGISDTSALGEVLSIADQILDQVTPVSEAVAQPQAEQTAEDVTEEFLAQEANRREKAERLAEARKLRTLVETNQVNAESTLSNTKDQAFLDRLVADGVELASAVEQLIAQIEPNPTARNTKTESRVPQEALDQAIANAARLNDRQNKRTVKARSIPDTLRNLANAVTSRAESLQRSLIQRGFGPTFASMFQTRRSKVKDLLASEDFIMEILTDPAAREEFFEKIGTTPAEEQTLRKFASFYTAFRDQLQANMLKLKKNASDVANQVEKNPLYFLQDENGNLDPNVVGAMALEAMQYLTTTGAQSTWNSPEDIRAILGLEDHVSITPDMIRAVGRGTLRSNVVQELGFRTMAHLNVEPKPGRRPMLNEITVAAMGAQILTTLADLGPVQNGVTVPRIKQHSISQQLWKDLTQEAVQEGLLNEKGEIVLVSNNVAEVHDVETNKLIKVDVNNNIRDAITEGRQILERLFGSTSQVRTPEFNKPGIDRVPTLISRSIGKIPQVIRERMLHDMRKPYEAESDVISVLDKFEDPEVYLQMAHEYLPEAELEKLHRLDRPGQEGRNLALLRDLNEALRWNRIYGRKKFYLPMKMTRSGRFNIDSNVINPQNSKIHRFMFIREAWERSITKADPGALSGQARAHYEHFMMAVGLGIGIKTDRVPKEEVVRQVEEFFADGEGLAALRVLNTTNEKFNEDELKALTPVLKKEGTHTLAALVAYNKWNNAQPGERVEISLPHETDGVTNGYAIGLLATPPADITPGYKRLLNAAGIFFEGDPWKNLAEYVAEGNLDNYQQIAKDTAEALIANYRGALAFKITKKTDWKESIPALIRRDTAIVAQSGLVPERSDLFDDGVVSKIARDWAKDPLMVMSYGAGTASITRAVVNAAIEKFYKELAKAGHPTDKDGNLVEPTAEDIAIALNRAYKIINTVIAAHQKVNKRKFIGRDENNAPMYESYKFMGTASADGLITAAEVTALAEREFNGDLRELSTEFVMSKEAQEHLRMGLKETYGQALTESLKKRLDPVMGIRQRMNATNKMVNMIYVAEYNRQIKELVDAGERPTAKVRLGIQKGLMRQGLVPTIPTAESENVDDSLPMTAEVNEDMMDGSELLQGVGMLENPRQLTEITYGINNQERIPNRASTITGRLKNKTPSDDVGVSAVVKSIHALDGVINSLIWGRSEHAVVNIHDAQLSPWWAAEEIAQNANTGFAWTIAGYNMPQEFLQSANRIVKSLMPQSDTRLSDAEKDNIAERMYEYYVQFPTIISASMPGFKTTKERGYWIMNQLMIELEQAAKTSHEGKAELFSEVRWINQFAQEGTEVAAPTGIDITNLGNQSDVINGIKQPAQESTLEESIQEETNQDTKFSEEFENQLEGDKVASVWEGLSQYETGDIDVSHQSHLRTLINDIVAPGLKTLEPIFQEVLEKAGEYRNIAEWEGDLLRLKTAGHRLTSNADVSLQETAAQEYVSAIVSEAINNDHFSRKEARRLFELAEKQITVQDFMPTEVVGDPAIALERAQERYDYIFNDIEGNEAYERFVSIGLTNQPFARALSRIDNQDETFTLPNWERGYLRGLLSLFRQMIQRLSGTAIRHNGGNISDALTALAKTTIATNQRNQQRLKELREGTDTTSRVQKFNQKAVNAVNRRFIDPLAAGLQATRRKRLDPENPNLAGFLKSATYVALKSRDDEVRQEYNKFYREITAPYNVGKDNAFFQTIAEITPWADNNLNWMDLLRKSKYIVDMARQEVSDHTRTFILSSFDKNNYMTKAHKMAITRTILKTDLSSLMAGEQSLKLPELAKLLSEPDAVVNEQMRLEGLLRASLGQENQLRLYNLFVNQAKSLGNFMVHGVHTVENPMNNAYNIVRQFMLDKSDQRPVADIENVESIVDRLATIYALGQQTTNDLLLTNDIMQHEMGRTDTSDNGFSNVIGMQINFKELAKEKLFDGQPIQMIKGYVYEIFDGDVNIEYVEEGSDREQELIAQGMRLVGPLEKDSHDDYKGQRVLYKGLKGLNTYNKSIVSLTDMQHRGANLFTTNGFQSQASFRNLKRVRENTFLTAKRQFKEGYTKPGANMVPVLNNQGEIIDYRYMMSDRNKQKILKKEDPFDRVLPKMFASITDRNSTKEINLDVVRLLKAEWTALKDSPAERFIRIGANPDPSATPKQRQASKDMWNLLPEEMQRNAEQIFGFKGMYIRDDVANLVLGFRKATITNLKKPGEQGGTLWGRGTPIVRMGEKVWQEIVRLMRIKIAILTPAVVVGNIASNTAMLLSEGIPLNYIRKNTAEAISGMRQYQKDRKAATELERQIGVNQSLGKDTRALEARFSRLLANLEANPVGQLVEEGLFTSITADLGVDDDTLRGSLLQKAEDAVSTRGGRTAKGAFGIAKEAYMLPGSKGYQAAVAATQYGDFVGRYVKFKYDTQVNKKDEATAINEALSAFIYYDIPQPKYLQALNDSGLVMFTKFFLRIQPIVARMYTQNPVSAFSVLGLQKALLPDPFNENIMNYGLGDGLTNKWNNPLNLPGKAYTTLDPTEPALLQWILNPFGL